MENKNENKEMNTTVRIIGEINVETLKYFYEETDKIIEAYKQYKAESSLINPIFLQSFPPITIEISSYGGCTSSGSAIIHRMDEMKEMGIQVNTHCNFAYSIAFIIYVNGMKRTAGKLAKFMNHGSGSYNMGYIEEQRKTVEFSARTDEQFEQIIYDNTNMSKERVEKARLCYDWIDTQEAIELGIINYGYEGCEPDWDELDEKFNQATALAIQTFAQLMDMEEGELAITLLHTGLSEILGLNDEDEDEKGDEEMEDKKECECGGNCECDGNCKCHKEDDEDTEEIEDEEVDEVEDKEDENESSKTLGEILSKYEDDEDSE